jgi:enoyl-CoA hydratase/carnithine racemase
MTISLTPTELRDVLADGLDDTSLIEGDGFPAVVVDLSEPFDRGDLQRVAKILATMPVVTLGFSPSGPVDDPIVQDLDLLLCGGEEAPFPWVGCGNELALSLASLRASIVDAPDAAVALVKLLRVGESAGAADAVIAESWVYSLLQSGPRYARWLESRSSRTPKARPDSSVVDVERVGDCLTITLNRPEVHNAYGTRMRDELVEAFRFAALDKSLTSVVLCGKGPSFCSGGDLDEFGTAPSPVEAHAVRMSRNAGVALAAIADRVEVHVHGNCVGAGVELPAFASRVVAHSQTTFLLPEVSMGLVPGAGGTSSIPRRIGRHRAAFFGLCRTTIDAETALTWHLIDEIDDDHNQTLIDARSSD